jgi:hypothetical protein
VESRIFLGKILGFWVYTMELLNILPMLRNLFVPLYQDYTRLGRIIAFPIRSTWVLVGLLLQIVIIPPILFMILVYLLMPIAPFYGIFSYLVNL